MQNELDILKEVGSIATAHGSIALSEILGRRINLSVPTVDIVSCAGVPTKIDTERIGIAVVSILLTGLKGKVVYLLNEKNAFKLVDLSYKLGEKDKKAGILTEMGMSLIKEIGSIVIGAYVGALSMMFKRLILPSFSILISGAIEEILSMIISAYRDEDYAFLIESVFEEPEEEVKGSFFLVLTPDAASEIVQICKKMLEEGNIIKSV